MDNSHEVAEQVGILGAIATFILGIFGIHRHHKEKVEARLHDLDTRKAERAEVDAIRDEIRDFAKANDAQHNMILGHLLGKRE